MHSLFADWLRESGLDLHDRPLDEWWQGLEDYCGTLTRSSLLALLRLAVIKEAIETDVPENFREAIKAKDGGFRMRDNLFEVQQLARVAIRSLFENAEVDESEGRTAALGLLCGAFGRNNGKVYGEHTQKAIEFLAKAGDELRIRPKISLPSATSEKPVSEAGDLNQLKTAVAPLMSSMHSTIAVLTQRSRLQDEEINMLWWIFGEQSRDLKVSFQKLAPGEAAIIAAKELADLTVFPPGPVSFEGILCRAISSDSLDRKIKLEDVINSLNIEWRNKFVEPINSLGDALNICPLHLMIKKSVEATSKKDWPVLLRAACDVSSALKASPRAVAAQFYHERMFVKSLEYID